MSSNLLSQFPCSMKAQTYDLDHSIPVNSFCKLVSFLDQEVDPDYLSKNQNFGIQKIFRQEGLVREVLYYRTFGFAWILYRSCHLHQLARSLISLLILVLPIIRWAFLLQELENVRHLDQMQLGELLIHLDLASIFANHCFTIPALSINWIAFRSSLNPSGSPNFLL